ncbi:MAG: Rpn family recombination-promoting nuclease/putative transposase [Saprospiraceae bacterium]
MSKKRLSHDAFFKLAFSDIDISREYIKHFLPERLVASLQLAKLKLSNQSFVTPKLKQYYSDLVYQCLTNEGKPIEVALLFEHKNDIPIYPHIQLLRYQLEYWENQFKQKKGLTPIIPIVVYQGKQKWTKRPFKNYFLTESDVFHPFIPSFDYCLTDINQIPDGELMALTADLLSSILLLMKSIKSQPEQHFTQILMNMENKIGDHTKRNLIEGMIVYFLQNAEICIFGNV